MKEEKRKVYYLFSPFLRIFHWIMVLSIVVLFVTGILITKPATIQALEPTFTSMSMDWVRNIHFIFAFLFCASFILRIYGFIINKGDRLFPRVWEGHFYSETIDVAMHYMLLKPSHAPFLRNPLARSSYAGLYVMVLIEILTGFAMYYMTEPGNIGGTLFGWVNVLLGGEMVTHWVHHIVAWLIIVFAIGHVYMVLRADLMEAEGEASSMFSGVKFLEHVPKDACEVEPPTNAK
ncbi:MAG: Ni/Fe-hydrogenase, b-type cytochrome subunit [Selenomonas sp.]|jgi:Ni/Fe-hydrogenase 1 B-type cytochrome subunit|nr:Ni/Fe-hydrogenase, b-type cytochrome subunit [Selenomonas sp.]MCI7330046.1 Ni/Fe-hydrogenase, b-type cytochrome subunit [Selenomonadaceae bacterium]MDD6120499.1 Ni/Fe-hydrogenase, b-type cytochrome subunit [Selenomonadaceae bacterium]MDD7056670.1 Ni/Fe-hydrogenase, b-type cytochrome subunit [Selenomonadaceae bacterium]MDY3915884.1 Ni/Fe-hydrogenase, b-type cytochrome subunit [Selenomonadaceae bacterium]